MGVKERNTMEKENNFNIEKGDTAAVILIELGRIYDLLSIIASGVAPEKTKAIIELHKQGKILAPPPAIEIGEIDD